MAKILVTGGCGFIGSHTVVDLVEAGYQVVSVDNYSNSYPWIEDRIVELIGRDRYEHHEVDLRDYTQLSSLLSQCGKIDGVIHFAAFKSVAESVKNPLKYFDNNLIGLNNILKACDEFAIPYLVFSSSCTVYGNPPELPVTENTPLPEPESPYGRTKRMGEDILKDYVKASSTHVVSLRYFNPVGAHPSIRIGELPIGVPSYLVPYITQTAIGLREKLTIFGGDYPTRDGSCIRDFIHVCDIATAHTQALEFMLNKRFTSQLEIFNLGTGNGVTVKEAVQSFLKVSGVNLNYEIGPRRDGDVVAIYADNTRAKEVLGWIPRLTLDDMMDSAWRWELSLKEMNDQLIR